MCYFKKYLVYYINLWTILKHIVNQSKNNIKNYNILTYITCIVITQLRFHMFGI